MRRIWLSFFFLALTVIGSSCAPPPGDTTLFDATRTLGPPGGSIDSPAVSVSFAAGTLGSNTSVTLTVYPEQFTAIAHDGYLHSEQGVRLRFDSSQVADGQTVEITASYPGDYDPFGTLLAVMKDDGSLLALPSEAARAGKVKGELSEAMLEVLFPNAGPGEQQTLRIFSANRRPEPTAQNPFLSSVTIFKNGAWGGLTPDLSGKRVALLVHGLDSSLADLVGLGQFVHDFKLTGETSPYYDVVLGYQYTSNRPIAEIGTDLAQFMNIVGLQDAAAVDLFAHSMGNLVSRYAMETTDTKAVPKRIANVAHYVSLGGPHDGVPFGNLGYAVQTFFYLYPFEDAPCLKDLLTDGKEGEPETDFLKILNLSAGQQGPNFLTTEYYTMSGSDWNDYDPPVGYTISYLYTSSVGAVYPYADYKVIEDGLVANYSAQSELLSRQSQTWSANEPFDLTHTGLHDSPIALKQIASWISGWQ